MEAWLNEPELISADKDANYAEILDIIHPHPTISESILEATADSADEPIHI